MSIKEFSIHPLSAFLFSLIAWTGVILFTGMLMGMAAGAAMGVAAGPSVEDFKLDYKLFGPLVIFTSFPVRVIAAIYIGCWIGTRSRSYVLAIVACSIALGSGLAFLFSLVTLSSDQIQAVFGERGTLERLTTLLPDVVIYIISAALGFWYGQRQKPMYYLGFIMKILRPETRQTMVEMVQDEAKRAGQPRAGQVLQRQPSE